MIHTFHKLYVIFILAGKLLKQHSDIFLNVWSLKIFNVVLFESLLLEILFELELNKFFLGQFFTLHIHIKCEFL